MPEESFDELSRKNAESFEKVAKEKQKFKYAFGPLNKDKATVDLEQIFKDLVEDAMKQDKSIKITLENKQLFYQKGENEKVNLTDLLSRANLTHLNIDPAIIETYSNITEIHDNPATKVVKSGNLVQKEATKALTEEDFKVKINRATPAQKEYLQELSYGECLAIYRYTSPEYVKINGLMRGDYRSLKKLRELQEEVVKSALMHTIVASSALNKIPDIDLPTVTRRQGDFGIDQMIENVKNNLVTQEKAFISTSFEDHDIFKKTYPNQIILKNVQGKDISAISYFGKEKEYLISPSTQLKWTGHTMDGENHIFTVEGSNVLLDQRMEKNATSLTVSERVARKVEEKGHQAVEKVKNYLSPNKKNEVEEGGLSNRIESPLLESKASVSEQRSGTEANKGVSSDEADERYFNMLAKDGEERMVVSALKPAVSEQRSGTEANKGVSGDEADERYFNMLAKDGEERMVVSTPVLGSGPYIEGRHNYSGIMVSDIGKNSESMSVLQRFVKKVKDTFYYVIDEIKDKIEKGNERTVYMSNHDKRALLQELKREAKEEKLMLNKTKDVEEEVTKSQSVILEIGQKQTIDQDSNARKTQINIGEHRIDNRLIEEAHNIEHKLENEGLITYKNHSNVGKKVSSPVVSTHESQPITTKQQPLGHETVKLETIQPETRAHTFISQDRVPQQELEQAGYSLEKPKKPPHPGWALGISFGVAVSAVALAGPAGLPVATVALTVGVGVAIYRGIKRHQIEQQYKMDVAIAAEQAAKRGVAHHQIQSKTQNLEAPDTPSTHVHSNHTR